MALCAPAALAQDTAARLADSLDLASIQKEAEQIAPDIDVRSLLGALLSGEMDAGQLRQMLVRQMGASEELSATLIGLAAPIAIWSVCAAVIKEKGGSMAGRFCALTAAAAMLRLLSRCAGQISALAGRIAALCESVAPVLSSLLSASGGVSSAALLSPAASLAAQMAADCICRVTLPALGCAGMIAVCAAFSRRFSFSGVRRLLTGACNWAHGAMVAVLLGVLTARGLVSGGADSISMQTARYTVDSLLPVVGGDIADSLGLLVASAKMVIGGAGVTFCILLLLACAGPVCTTAASFLLLRLCRALCEPLDLKEAQEMLDGFSEVLCAMLVAIVCAALLFVLIVGAAVSLGRSIA